jgi:hypothetical protein
MIKKLNFMGASVSIIKRMLNYSMQEGFYEKITLLKYYLKNCAVDLIFSKNIFFKLL